jgi:hypothetical protein
MASTSGGHNMDEIPDDEIIPIDEYNADEVSYELHLNKSIVNSGQITSIHTLVNYTCL